MHGKMHVKTGDDDDDEDLEAICHGAVRVIISACLRFLSVIYKV